MKICDKSLKQREAINIMVDIDELKFPLTLLLVALLMLQTDCEISGALIKSFGDGGIVDGDPAPGRSPGPPEHFTTLQGTSEEYPSAFLTATESFRNCDLNTTAEIPTNTLVDVKISHHLFKTDVLVPDIVYQGKVDKNFQLAQKSRPDTN